MKEWTKFVASGRHCDDLEWEDASTPSRFYLPMGQPFFTDTRPGSKRYGALMKDTGRGVLHASYIHGDYDLFAIVPADNPGANIVVSEQHSSSPWSHLHRVGKAPAATHEADKTEEQKTQEIPNFRGQKFIDVQNMLNRRMGVNMVLHGSQEKAVNSFDEEVDVFMPNGMDSFPCSPKRISGRSTTPCFEGGSCTTSWLGMQRNRDKHISGSGRRSASRTDLA
jgi:hypothetical protein